MSESLGDALDRAARTARAAVRRAVAEEIAEMLEERATIHSTGIVRMALADAAAEAREIGTKEQQ